MLTATQKLKLADLQAAYMTQEWGTGFDKYDAKESGKKLSTFADYYKSLGLTMAEAESVCWDVQCNYHTTYLDAYLENPSAFEMTRDQADYLKRQAAKEPNFAESKTGKICFHTLEAA